MPTVEKQPAWLRSLVTTKVALVDRGANPHADVVLYKRDAEQPTPDPAPAEPEPTPRLEHRRTRTTEVKEEEVVTQAVVYDKLQKLAEAERASDPTLTPEQAFVKVLDTEEGQQLRKSYHDAPPEPLEDVSAPVTPVAGGDEAESTAAKLDKLVGEVAERRSISKSAAYDVVLATPEGANLMAEYRGAIGDDSGAADWQGFAKSRS
jgi:hypothetical protein